VALSGRSQFDGFDPANFVHADTLDSSRNRLVAGRIWAEAGDEVSTWSGRVSASLLGSRNRNFLANSEINRTSGRRATIDAQVQYRFQTSAIAHRLIVAAEHEIERFHAGDTVYFRATDQSQDRTHQALTAEWRAEAGPVTTDVAVRRDLFNRFEDATSLRASVLGELGGGISATLTYGEGIAQPTFFDLYGFFPGSFVGNPSLKPESSRGYEASLRYRKGAISGAITAYRQRLKDEIVDTFDPVTFLSSTENRAGKSRRSGFETEAGWALGERLRLTANYAHLKASEPGSTPDLRIKEARRPKHSGSIAANGQAGRLTYGVSLAYTGDRIDTDFDSFPARRVTLDNYWIAGARLAYEVRPGVQVFARSANALNARYQDAVGYRTEPRSIYAGIRIAPRR
jgi:vitamin B12 transporter